MSGKEKSRIANFGNNWLDFSMASAPLLASMQSSKPGLCSKSERRTGRKESSLSTMSTVEMFPSKLVASGDKRADLNRSPAPLEVPHRYRTT